jgi:hypothetical protein
MSPLTESTRLILKKDSVAATDTNIREVSLLLHGNGTNGSTTITDSSLTPKTVTAVGNAQISTAQSKFGGASIAFDGNGDYLNFSDSGGVFPNTDNFTVETWAWRSSIGTQTLLAPQSSVLGNFQLGFFGTTELYLTTTTAAGNVVTWNQTWSPNVWYHIAVTRSGNVFRIFVDGNNIATATSSFSGTSYTSGRIGESLNGYIDDLRITKGVARYTSNFTPPTLPFPDF